MSTPARLVSACALLVAAIVVAGCENTIRGAGQDVRETAQAVEGAVAQ